MPLNTLGVGMAITLMEVHVIVDIEPGIILLSFHPADDTNDVHFLTPPNYRFVENCFLKLETEIKQVMTNKINKQTKNQTEINHKTISWHVHKISSQILRTLRQTRRRLASRKKSDRGSQSCSKRALLIHFVIFIPRKRSSIRFGRTYGTLVLKTLAGLFKSFVCNSFLYALLWNILCGSYILDA